MPLFRCDRCNCVENTAPSHYWSRKEGDPKLCTECDPAVGKWHGMFEKRSAADMVEGPDGFLYTKEEVERKKWADQVAKSAKNIAHIGLEGVARHAFECGWNYGAAWVREGKTGGERS